MNDCDIIIDENIQDINISISDNLENINVSIDNTSPNLQQFYATLQNLNIIYSLSSKWQETSEEMDTLQETLSSKWQETFIEMDTLQNDLSANWQDTYEKTKSGIIDGGLC
jgi:hypothetical protein